MTQRAPDVSFVIADWLRGGIDDQAALKAIVAAVEAPDDDPERDE